MTQSEGTPDGPTPPAADAPGASRLRSSRLSLLAAPLFVAVAVQSAANLVFHAVVGRQLPAADYGALGTVLAAMTLVAVPLSALQTASARTTALSGLTAGTARRALGRTLAFSVPVAILILVAAAPVAHFLHLNSLVDAAILGPTLVAAALVSVARGLLLGVGRSGIVAGSFILATVVRLGPGLVLAMTQGVTGALLGTLLGEVAGLLLVSIACLRATAGEPAVLSGADFARTGAVVTGLFLFSTVDLFLARHYLAGDVSGAYVAAATIGKTVLALPAAAISIAYPRLVAGWSGGRRLGTLLSALGVVCIPAALAGAVVIALPGLVLTVLYGSGTFPGAEPLVRLLAGVAVLSSVVTTLAHAGLARTAVSAWFPWPAAALEIVAIAIWHDDALMIAAASAAVAVCTVAWLALWEIPRWRSRPDRAPALPTP